jgi:ABC-type polysaccharide/polyol phosphate transport system ATPase subunit
MSAAVEVAAVSKRFTITAERAESVSGFLLNALRRRRLEARDFWALREVSFSVGHGESLGIIGANGSGKSTLLKLLAGIYTPTAGTVCVHGSVAALLELGAGFHGELSGRENIYLHGSLLGRGRGHMARLLDEIVAFAEIGPFLDTPLKQYSSGMQMRLGFAVATALRAEIMLLDEVLAVGDAAFQARCVARLQEFQREGRTLILVSHSMALIEALCPRALWLRNGEIAALSGPSAVIAAYEAG